MGVRSERASGKDITSCDTLGMVMFERFSADARSVAVAAGHEAFRLRHKAIRTEHLLVGLLTPRAGTVASWLAIEGVYLADMRESLWGEGAADIAVAAPPPTTVIAYLGPEARIALEDALQESATFDQDEVRPEHILLAVLSDVNGLAARALADVGASVASLRRQALAVLAGQADQD